MWLLSTIVITEATHVTMAKRHQSGDHLISQIRRCQEIIMARTGVDEFYETIRLIIAKSLWEKTEKAECLSYDIAQDLLRNNKDVVERFVEGDALLCAPREVSDECIRILTPTDLGDTPYEALHTVFEQMTGKQYKSDKGQYFTPPHVVDFCIAVLRPAAGELICDPACGSGAFLKSAYDQMPVTEHSTTFGFDISKRAAKTAALLSYLACNDSVRVRQLDALAVEPNSLYDPEGLSIEECMRRYGVGFQGFDIIATNPPFAGDVSDADFLSYYETSKLAGGKVERDILFLERCKNLLKPGGRLAIVLPDNKFSGAKFAGLRKWICKEMDIKAVVSLHSYTFRPFTSQKTCVLFAQRKSGVMSDSMVSFYRSDKAGKSSNGDPVFLDGTLDHDLGLIASEIIGEWKIEQSKS
ncbi:Type I restriction-modification system methyltransferase subunit [Pseudomonas coronafaciens pv. coronafaciens]|uniref:HsdM family class I SAM-dependent methyltransferase n=1 Tax=Pseudomonas coronafaciens TaxID=53409 RepID=UPI000EFDC6C3|nr:N-6 DNA methylase [Pseudomonas coronafaciens]RMN99257.1 Type I restriction-modification system methyltransferase subunit [Pseudomonas coronafaciens pv. coronafaciens]